MKKLLFLSIVLFASLSATGQTNSIKCGDCGNLTGFIYRSDSRLSEKARVFLLRGSQIKDSTLTNGTGSFNFSGLFPGRYNIEAKASNHKKHLMTGIIISPTRTTFVNLNMTPDTGSRDLYRTFLLPFARSI